jgi:secondary thiamine-phosphate synthase enzyme
MKSFEVASENKVESIDVTAQVNAAVREEGVREGVIFVYVPHCTCALVVNESEPNIREDYEKFFSRLSEGRWKHDAIDDNASAHLASALAGTSRFFFVEGGELVLGTWQRILLLEFDGPRKRKVLLKMLRL